MGHLVLVTGGARSGKSALAEGLALKRSSGRHVYIATAGRWGDVEMDARIQDHIHMRAADGWSSIEEPHDLVAALRRTEGDVRLIDCLTLWLAQCHPGHEARLVGELVEALAGCVSPVVVVTNELGLGIVPADAATRAFRDRHGKMNQAVAAIADEVWMAVCGMPLCLKKEGKPCHEPF